MRIVLISVILLISISATAQIPQEIETTMNSFFSLLKKNDLNKAAKVLRSTNPHLKNFSEENLKISNGLREHVLNINRNSFLNESLVNITWLGTSKNYIRISYLLSFEEFPVLAEIYFYKTDSKWMYQSIRYISKPEEIFEIVEEYDER